MEVMGGAFAYTRNKGNECNNGGGFTKKRESWKAEPYVEELSRDTT
jgi:hypothetical protein